MASALAGGRCTTIGRVPHRRGRAAKAWNGLGCTVKPRRRASGWAGEGSGDRAAKTLATLGLGATAGGGLATAESGSMGGAAACSAAGLHGVGGDSFGTKCWSLGASCWSVRGAGHRGAMTRAAAGCASRFQSGISSPSAILQRFLAALAA